MARRKLLVDTSVVVDLFEGDQVVALVLDQYRPVYIPVVVLAELLLGARRSRRPAENVERIEAFASMNRVLPCNRTTASHYADIANQLRARGRPIPQNDMWIAAVAQQHGLAVASRDGHFDEVESLVRIPC
jgi:tRNA(fMet)-specific endonuclease VapC